VYHIALTLFTLFNALATNEHAIYLSVVEITDLEDSIEFNIKVFRDDMVDALRNQDDTFQSTMETLVYVEVQSYFEKYIKLYPLQNNTLRVNQITIEGESFFINLETDRALDTVEELNVSHFFELFSNQKNITKITTGGQQHFYTYKYASQLEDLSLLH